MRSRAAASNYSRLDNENKSLSGDPNQLITLLFEKACACVRRAIMLSIDNPRQHEDGNNLANIEEYYKSVAKALEIVVALRELVDLERGGEVGKQLKETYSAIGSALWRASKDKDKQSLEKIYLALDEIRLGWQGAIDKQQVS